jgi:hypothetical protein
VKERVDLYHQQREAFVAQLRRCSSVRGSVVVVDLRHEEIICAGNRFMVYALFPDCVDEVVGHLNAATRTTV